METLKDMSERTLPKDHLPSLGAAVAARVREADVSGLHPDDPLARELSRELKRIFFGRGIGRVLFVAPPDGDARMFDVATARRGRYWNYPPYGAGVLATVLRRDGIEVSILNLNNTVLGACRNERDGDFDFTATVRQALSERIGDFAPDLIGVTCMFSQSHRSTVDTVKAIKALAPEIPLAMGGVHATNALAENTTRDALLSDFSAVDFMFLYEADTAFRDFVRAVNAAAEISDLSQVLFRRAGVLVGNRKVPSGADLDVVPAHDLMTPGELAENGKIGSFYCLKPDDARFTTVLSNRGCRGQCTFCSVRTFNGVGVRQRSVASVVDELQMLRDDYGIDHIMWLDDDLLYDHARALALFEEMIRRGLGMTWDCTNGVLAASCTTDVMTAAADAGCIGLNIGMESGNPEILRQVKKPGTVKNFLAAAKVLRGIERINARVFLMIGFPGETYRQIMDTIDVAREMDLDWVNVTILQPLPNTPIYDEMAAAGLIGTDADFSEIRYNSGVYGKHRKIAEAGTTDLLASDFKDAFSGVDANAVPSRADLDDIWAYMNYHLNFRRLFQERRPLKLHQEFLYVRNIAEVVAPENAFAAYFEGYLSHRVEGRIAAPSIARLERLLARSPYWRQRFLEFNLSLDDLKSATFPVGPDAGGKKCAKAEYVT